MCNRRPLKRVGNRTASHLSASHVTDSANRLTEDDSFCYTYDANGNLTDKTAKVAGVCTGGVTAYGYDIGNKLTQIDFPDLTVATYAYDGFGRRIEKDVDGVITRYVYDGEDIVMEFDGVSTLLARYSHGDQTDQPLSVERARQAFLHHQATPHQWESRRTHLSRHATREIYVASVTMPQKNYHTLRANRSSCHEKGRRGPWPSRRRLASLIDGAPRQRIGALVPGIAGVALDPAPFDLVAGGGGLQPAP